MLASAELRSEDQYPDLALDMAWEDQRALKKSSGDVFI